MSRVTLAEALNALTVAETVEEAHRLLDRLLAWVDPAATLPAGSAAPMRTACSWCTPPGDPNYDGNASHGICQAHADQILLAEPIEIAIQWLRGGDVSTREARTAIAAKLQEVVARLDRLIIPRSS